MSQPPEAFQLAAQLHQAGRLAEAQQLCGQIVAANPAQADAWLLLGIIGLQTGDQTLAIECFERSLSLQPVNADAQNGLAVALKNQGRLPAALIHFRRAAELSPALAEVQFNLARALHEAGDFAAAGDVYRKTIALKPDFPAARLGLADVLCHQGALNEAIEHYQQSLQLDMRQPNALLNLGAALQRLGRTSDAIAAYRHALSIDPNLAEAYNRLGIALRFLGSLDEAAACFRRAIELDANQIEALTNLGNTFKDAGQIDEALACLERVIASRPDLLPAYSNFLYSIVFSPRYDAAAIYEHHRRWNESFAAPLSATIAPYTNLRHPNRRLRIGYVSPHFRSHAIAHALVPLFRHHDHTHFEIICYSDDPAADDITHELRRHADAWHSIVGLTDDKVAARIRDDQIDILVDLTMHMSSGRPLLFARKPAPLQVCWLAYPGTTGLTTIDYRLTDPHIDPPGLFDSYYSEISFRLPHSFWCYDPLADGPSANNLPALTNGYVTFGNLNNPCKTNAAVFDLWARVLSTVENSRLLLLVFDPAQAGPVRAQFQRRGISPDRVHPVDLRPRPQYLELYHQIDIGLDTFPYNGHNTSLDSYWMGVPVITLVGQTVVGRAGLSQLTNLNLPDLIAYTPDQFLSLSRSLASDLPLLAALRASLRHRMQASPLMNAPRFAQNLESAYRQLWCRNCAK